MRLIDADALIGRDVGIAWVSTEAIESAPTVDAIALPCPIGSDFWWVDTDDMSVNCERGGIRGFEIRDNGTLYALDPQLEVLEIHSRWCCLSREEAEAFREKLLSAK